MVNHRTSPEGAEDAFQYDANFTAVWRTALLLERFRILGKICKPQDTAEGKEALEVFLHRALILTEADSFPPISTSRWPGNSLYLKQQDALSLARDILAGRKDIHRPDLENLRKLENRIDPETAEWVNRILEGVKTHADMSAAKKNKKGQDKKKKTIFRKLKNAVQWVKDKAARTFRPFEQQANPFKGLRHVSRTFLTGEPELPPGFIQAPPGKDDMLVTSRPSQADLRHAARGIIDSLKPGEEIKMYYHVQATGSSSALMHSLVKIGTNGSVTFTLGPNLIKGMQNVISIANTGAGLQVFVGSKNSLEVSVGASVCAAASVVERGIARASVAGAAHASVGRSQMKREGVQIVLPCKAGSTVSATDKADCAGLMDKLIDRRDDGTRPVECILTTYQRATMSKVDGTTKGKSLVVGASAWAGPSLALGLDDLNNNSGAPGKPDLNLKIGVGMSAALSRRSAKTETSIRGAARSNTKSAWSQTNLDSAVYLSGGLNVGSRNKKSRVRGIVNGTSDLHRKQTRLAERPITGLACAETRDGMVAQKNIRSDRYEKFRAFAEKEMRMSLRNGTRPEALPHREEYKARQDQINEFLKKLETRHKSATAFKIVYELRLGSHEAAAFRNAMAEADVLEMHGLHAGADACHAQADKLLRKRHAWQVVGIAASSVKDHSGSRFVNLQLPYQVMRKSGVSREAKTTSRLNTAPYPRRPELQFPDLAAPLRMKHLVASNMLRVGCEQKFQLTRGDPDGDLPFPQYT